MTEDEVRERLAEYKMKLTPAMMSALMRVISGEKIYICPPAGIGEDSDVPNRSSLQTFAALARRRLVWSSNRENEREVEGFNYGGGMGCFNQRVRLTSFATEILNPTD